MDAALHFDLHVCETSACAYSVLVSDPFRDIITVSYQWRENQLQVKAESGNLT